MNAINLRRSIQTLVTFLILALLGGCVSSEQRAMMDDWHDMTSLVHDLRWEFGVEDIPSDYVLLRLGKPDRRIEAKHIRDELCPDDAGGRVLKRAIEDRSEFLAHLGKSTAGVEGEIMASTFWFYEEGTRWTFKHNPDTWGYMGMGFEVVWFAVDKDGMILVADGAGIRSRRNMLK